MPSTRKLARYRAKRDFKKTNEPSGRQKRSSGNSYLIQKHAARRLHYDFRLEMDGVLKSWAVTRGPSLNPEDKRLAVHVEDHPLEYGKFEGTIPKGQYGGGTVMLWDQGDWEPLGDAARGYKKGHLDFELHGKRLKGRWHLVRMHGRRRGDEKRENWLLIKGKDRYADEHGDKAIERFQKSVVSNRSMEAIAGAKKVWRSKKEKLAKEPEKKTKIRNRHRQSPPDFIPPQLATLVSDPPKGEGWVHEIKFDGYRLLARLEKGKVRLVTRANNDWTGKFKGICAALSKLDVDNALIDGEAVHLDASNTMSFHGLQQALSEGEQKNIHYYAFDLLFLNGEDLRARPLLERKEVLKKILKKTPTHLHYSEHFAEPGTKVLSHACDIALEGIVSKRADAAYHSGRDELWLKSKCTKEQELVIGGFTGQPKHPGALGALLMGYCRGDDFIYAGKVGTGFSQAEGRSLLKKLSRIKQKTSPFKAVPAAAKRGARFVRPEMVAHINFTEWTADGAMRHPSFQGLREDKPARQIVREKEKPLPKNGKQNGKEKPMRQNSKDAIVGGVKLTHPDKKLFPGADIAKLDVARYYEKIAPHMLPHMARRPISLVRCPEGEGTPCFFQRHGSETLSPYVKPVRVEKGPPYLMIEDVRGLIALVQMGVLEIHAWGSKADDPSKPDRLVFDLDPAPGVPWAAVKAAALDVRAKLKLLKLDSFLKATGGKGLHVVVPFQKGPSWKEAKGFARSFAEAMVREKPGNYTVNNRKAARAGKIFIDYLRNGEGASAIALYSTRAKPGAPVAAPVHWKELKQLKSAAAFNMQNVLRYKGGDPWKAINTLRQKLPSGN
jgi:bifunctional non-homologous end joining protein LigD